MQSDTQLRSGWRGKHKILHVYIKAEQTHYEQSGARESLEKNEITNISITFLNVIKASKQHIGLYYLILQGCIKLVN